MNEELIRKLHDQAWGETHEKAIAVTETPIDFQKVLRERFAELIVRECAKVCRDQPNIYAMKVASDICATSIEEHFGVAN
jgi:hypothetical protein